MDKPSLKAGLHALAARQRDGENHPTPEELKAYRARELPPAEEDRIQEHLALCEDCVRLLLDLGEFERFKPAGESFGPIDTRTEAAWQALRSQIGGDTGEEVLEEGDDLAAAAKPLATLLPQQRPVVSLWRSSVLPWVLAAGFALCSIGLWWRVGSLERQLEEPVAVRVITLESEEDGARGNDRETPVHEGEGVACNLLLPSAPKARKFPIYQVRLVPASGGEESAPAVRQPADEGTLRIIVRSAPEAGDYVFEVFGIEGEREIPVGRYPLMILPPGASPG